MHRLAKPKRKAPKKKKKKTFQQDLARFFPGYPAAFRAIDGASMNEHDRKAKRQRRQESDLRTNMLHEESMRELRQLRHDNKPPVLLSEVLGKKKKKKRNSY
jgi:hypothetical protein